MLYQWTYKKFIIYLFVLFILYVFSLQIFNLYRLYQSKVKRLAVLRSEFSQGIKVNDIIENAMRYVPSSPQNRFVVDSINTYISDTVVSDRDSVFDKGSGLGPIKNVNSNQNDLLCATFIGSNDASMNQLSKRLQSMIGSCDWAIYVYGGDMDIAAAYKLQLIHMKLPKNNKIVAYEYNISRYDILQKYGRYDGNSTNLMKDYHKCPFNHKIFPKPMLMTLLIPLLHSYQYVWTFDGDISISSMDIDRLFHNLRSSLGGPILVAQPLIFDNTQVYEYLNYDSWNKETYRDVIAAETRFIEIQAPIFDAKYLTWYLRNIVSSVLWAVHILGADWGFDSLFCQMATLYAKTLCQRRSKYHTASDEDDCMVIPCGIIVDNSSIRHYNKKSIDQTMGYDVRKAFNHEMTSILRRLYSDYMLRGLNDRCNPLKKSSNLRIKTTNS